MRQEEESEEENDRASLPKQGRQHFESEQQRDSQEGNNGSTNAVSRLMNYGRIKRLPPITNSINNIRIFRNYNCYSHNLNRDVEQVNQLYRSIYEDLNISDQKEDILENRSSITSIRRGLEVFQGHIKSNHDIVLPPLLSMQCTDNMISENTRGLFVNEELQNVAMRYNTGVSNFLLRLNGKTDQGHDINVFQSVLYKITNTERNVRINVMFASCLSVILNDAKRKGRGIPVADKSEWGVINYCNLQEYTNYFLRSYWSIPFHTIPHQVLKEWQEQDQEMIINTTHGQMQLKFDEEVKITKEKQEETIKAMQEKTDKAMTRNRKELEDLLGKHGELIKTSLEERKKHRKERAALNDELKDVKEELNVLTIKTKDMETANTKGEDFIKLEEKLKMTEEITMAIYNIIKKSIDNIPSLDFNQNQTLHDFLDVVESLETKRYEQLAKRHSISQDMEN